MVRPIEIHVNQLNQLLIYIFFPLLEYNPHSNDSVSDSEMSVDDCFDNCDDGTSDTLSLQNVDIQSGGGLRHNHNNSICSLISAANPIDKLYSMQAHYFLSEQ